MDLVEIGKTPIPGDNPAGGDVSFEPEYEALEAELQKLTSPTAVGTADWDRITGLSADILSGKSKNLLVASYLNLGLLKTAGLAGFADGVHVLRDMLETYWETLFPPKRRMRGRLNAVTWWMDKIDACTEGCAVEVWPRERRQRLVEDLDFIDSFLGENMENAPSLRPLAEKIVSFIEEEPEPEPEPEPADQAIADGEPAPAVDAARPRPDVSVPHTAAAKASPATAIPKIDLSGADAETVLNSGLETLGVAAGMYLKEARFSPIAYRLNRIACWTGLGSLPSATGGRTLLPPPDSQIVDMLVALERAGNWDTLLDAAESRISQYLFWLDLNRYSAQALERLGHADAAEAVAEETIGYIKRLSGIETLAFSDGTPFAGPETREWLETQAVRLGGGGGSPGDGVEGNINTVLEDARKLIEENRLDQALGHFRGEMERSGSVRERFLWTAGMFRLLIGAKKPRLLVPYIRGLLDMIDTHHIERWEPDLAVEGLVLAARGALMLGEGAGRESVEDLVNRIAAINPGRALEFME